jgi:5-(carboxyamino)imidazole ribonucleotide synthase
MSGLPLLSVIGILGGGQLGRMTVDAAHRLGFRTLIYTPEPDSPASQNSDATLVADWDDEESLRNFAERCDVITLEFENVPVRAVEFLQQIRPVYPGAAVLRVAQNRMNEKSCANTLGFGTAPWAAIPASELPDSVYEAAGVRTGYPAILKTNTLGYDGKGQVKVHNSSEMIAAHRLLGFVECILEGFVEFVGEISVIAARSASGEESQFPVTWNEHRNHILYRSMVPAPVSDETAEKARNAAQTIARHLNVIGLLAFEFFVTPTGDVLVNEMAPRPHNSGHWTQNGCATDQFEQLVRSITGLPLGPTSIRCATTMINLIGDEVQQRDEWLKQGAHVHLYGKAEARPGRKMGHVNVCSPSTP